MLSSTSDLPLNFQLPLAFCNVIHLRARVAS